jgi:hypothetical protein
LGDFVKEDLDFSEVVEFDPAFLFEAAGVGSALAGLDYSHIL